MTEEKDKKFKLNIVPKSNPTLKEKMKIHYSQPKGFIGRQIIYEIIYDEISYGFIAGGSSALFLPGRNEFFGYSGTNKEEKQIFLKSLVNNTFFHVEKVNDKYPIRNFTSYIVKKWISIVKTDFERKYGDVIIGIETLVEPPRTGELYLKCGFTLVGITKGITCRRISGNSTDSWSGVRVWDKVNLRPKYVFCVKL